VREKRLSLLLGIALALVGVLAGPAQATSPLCGNSSVHGTVTLHATEDCAGGAGATLDGNATIELNGQSLTNGTGTAIENPGPFTLTILGPGTISNFNAAVDSSGRTTIRRVEFDAIDATGAPDAVVTISDAPKSNISRNVFSANNPSNTADYVLHIFSSPKSKVMRNSFTDNKALTQAVSVDGDKAVVLGNTVADLQHVPATYSDVNEGLFVSGDKTKVMKNSVSGFGSNGLRIDSSNIGKIELKKNHTDGNGVEGLGSGVFIEKNSGKVLLQRNESSNNSNFGYELQSGGNAIVRFKKQHNTGSGNTNGLCSPNLC